MLQFRHTNLYVSDYTLSHCVFINIDKIVCVSSFPLLYLSSSVASILLINTVWRRKRRLAKVFESRATGKITPKRNFDTEDFENVFSTSVHLILIQFFDVI